MSNKLKNVMDENILETTEKNDEIIEISEDTLEESHVNTVTTEEEKEPIATEKATEQKKYSPLGNIKTEKTPSKKSSYILLALILFCIIILIGVFSTVFAFLNIGSTKIISGISINGIDISGLTSKEATEKVSDILSEQLNTTLNLQYGDYTTTLIPSQEIDASYDIATAVEKAYVLGRSDNIFKNNFEIIYTYLTHEKLEMDLQYNEEKLESVVNNIALEIPGLVEQPSYYIENTQFYLEKKV